MLLDHLIYGTFPDLPGSQQVVYKSDGINSELEQWLIASYDEFGDCRSEEFKSSITVRWDRTQTEGICAITRVSQLGKDFSGRWGALLRHSAILSESQYRELLGNVALVARQLVSAGSSEELSQDRELRIEGTADPFEELSGLLAVSPDTHLPVLARMLAGERLLLYAENNSALSDNYLQTLIRLLPLKWQTHFDWSEFVFRPVDTLDLLIAHNARYETPVALPLGFASDAANHFASAGVAADEVEEFLGSLRTALAGHDRAAFQQLIEG